MSDQHHKPGKPCKPCKHCKHSEECKHISDEEAIEKANKCYSENYKLCHLREEATKHFVILTCMDARIDVEDLAGLHPGEAYILRNAGGRATDDMIRSLILVTRLFAVDEYFIIHHTDCGLEKIDDSQVRQLLRENLGPCTLDGTCERNPNNRDRFHQSDYVAFLAFENLKQSIIDDVYKVRTNTLISKKVRIHGYIYDVHTGKLHEVKEASKIGQPIEC